jgi:hypothetical protein
MRSLPYFSSMLIGASVIWLNSQMAWGSGSQSVPAGWGPRARYALGLDCAPCGVVYQGLVLEGVMRTLSFVTDFGCILLALAVLALGYAVWLWGLFSMMPVD